MVEHLTVGCAAIRWSLVRFRVAGFFTRTNDCKGSANHQHAPKARHNQLSEKKIKTTPVGFEPTRGDPIGLAGRRLNHSAKVSCRMSTVVGGAGLMVVQRKHAFQHADCDRTRAERSARATVGRKQRAVVASEKENHNQPLCTSGFATRRMAWGRQTGDIKFHLAIKTFKV